VLVLLRPDGSAGAAERWEGLGLNCSVKREGVARGDRAWPRVFAFPSLSGTSGGHELGLEFGRRPF